MLTYYEFYEEYKKDICINVTLAEILRTIGIILIIAGTVVLFRGFQDDVFIALTLYIIGGIITCAGNALLCTLGCVYGYRLICIYITKLKPALKTT